MREEEKKEIEEKKKKKKKSKIMVKESGEPNELVTHSFPYDLQPKGKRDTYPQILEMFKQVKMNVPLLEAIY